MVTMIRQITYKYRIYPSDEQIIQLAKTFGCCRFVFNHYLDSSKDNNYKSKVSNNNNCNRELKIEYSFLNEVDKFALTNSIKTLDNAFKRFFSKLGNYPKFKSKRHIQSYQTNYTNNNIEVLEKGIKQPKLGKVKAKVHREIEGRIINATVKKYSSGKYYVCILVEKEIHLKEEEDSVIGLDMGLTNFITDNKGNKVSDPKALSSLEKKLSIEQRKLSLKKKGSNNYDKQRIQVARVHERIENIRNNFLEQLSTKIVNENQVIVVEDLSIKKMMEERNLSKRLSDVSIATFIKKLEYKSKWYGRVFIKVGKYYPSSQVCSCCGNKNPLVKDLSIRAWECPICHTEHDRDINAAINILEEGIFNY